jgi:hypothetical protein
VRSQREETLLEPGQAVRSLQSAELVVPADALEQCWSDAGVSCLARNYWLPLARRTLHLLRLIRSARGARLVLGVAPFALIRFGSPRTMLGREVAEVSWPITGGPLVSSATASRGTLRITARREDLAVSGETALTVTVLVEGFQPRLRGTGHLPRIRTALYRNTQLRIHAWQSRAFFSALSRSFTPRVPRGA